MDFEMIRGKKAESRCNNVGTYGSPLYCDCGCQTPRDEDNTFDLTGLSAKMVKSFQAYTALIRDGKIVGSVDAARDYVTLDGSEYLGVVAGSLLSTVFDLPVEPLETETPETVTAGETAEETAAFVAAAEKIELAEMDERNKKNPGWCSKCHSYCYGDCES